MKKNMGVFDRLFRISFALVIGVLYFMGELTGIAAIILGIFAVVFALTSFIGFCPLYYPFKLSTLRKSNREPSVG